MQIISRSFYALEIIETEQLGLTFDQSHSLPLYGSKQNETDSENLQVKKYQSYIPDDRVRMDLQ